MDMVRFPLKAMPGQANPFWRYELRGEKTLGRKPWGISLILYRQEKPRCKKHWRPYRKPTQVGRGKRPKVNERTLVKEFDKLAL